MSLVKNTRSRGSPFIWLKHVCKGWQRVTATRTKADHPMSPRRDLDMLDLDILTPIGSGLKTKVIGCWQAVGKRLRPWLRRGHALLTRHRNRVLCFGGAKQACGFSESRTEMIAGFAIVAIFSRHRAQGFCDAWILGQSAGRLIWFLPQAVRWLSGNCRSGRRPLWSLRCTDRRAGPLRLRRGYALLRLGPLDCTPLGDRSRSLLCLRGAFRGAAAARRRPAAAGRWCRTVHPRARPYQLKGP